MQGKRPVRSYKEIALYTLASHGEYEAKAIGGFLKLARKHGADAVLIDRVATVRAERGGKIVDADARMEGGGVAAVVNPLAACVFRATAIVWTDQK